MLNLFYRILIWSHKTVLKKESLRKKESPWGDWGILDKYIYGQHAKVGITVGNSRIKA
ncbi:MAG: hypothetical protein KA801_14885 [Syntrophorhabdaceae bacterium]|nr:hypothetical protein [Syntrophorhabdaceae bacterium]